MAAALVRTTPIQQHSSASGEERPELDAILRATIDALTSLDADRLDSLV